MISMFLCVPEHAYLFLPHSFYQRYLSERESITRFWHGVRIPLRLSYILVPLRSLSLRRLLRCTPTAVVLPECLEREHFLGHPLDAERKHLSAMLGQEVIVELDVRVVQLPEGPSQRGVHGGLSALSAGVLLEGHHVMEAPAQ